MTRLLISRKLAMTSRRRRGTFTVGLLASVDESIAQLKGQKEAMKGMMESTLDRKLKFLRYNYKRIGYKMDETLFYLLQRIQEIDKGPDPVTFVNALKITSLADNKGNPVIDANKNSKIRHK